MDCSQPGPLSLGFCRKEYWCELPFPPPGALPDPGIETTSPVSTALQADSLPAEPPGKPCFIVITSLNVNLQIQLYSLTLEVRMLTSEFWGRNNLVLKVEFRIPD